MTESCNNPIRTRRQDHKKSQTIRPMRSFTYQTSAIFVFVSLLVCYIAQSVRSIASESRYPGAKHCVFRIVIVESWMSVQMVNNHQELPFSYGRGRSVAVVLRWWIITMSYRSVTLRPRRDDELLNEVTIPHLLNSACTDAASLCILSVPTISLLLFPSCLQRIQQVLRHILKISDIVVNPGDHRRNVRCIN